MTSFGYRLNPRYAIKECSCCGTLYTRDCVCSKGNVADKILVPELPKNCARCGHPVDGPYCQGCALLRQELEENLVTLSQDFQNTFESSNDSTNVFNAPREPFNSLNDSLRISENSSQSPPHINHCCYEYGDPLDGIFCKRCTCKSCGKYAHIGYNCPPKVPVISNPEPCKNQTIDELPQTLPSFHPTFHSGDESPFTCDSTRNYIDESPNVFNPPPQPLMYSCEFCGNDAHYGHYCTPQAPFIYPEPCYNQDFNFPQDFHNFPQQYPCCDDCGVTHEAYQCQPKNHNYYNEQNSCYDSTSIGFDQSQPQQYTVNHPIFNAHNDYLDSQIKLNSTLTKLMEQMTSLTLICEMACQIVQKKQEEKQLEEEQAAKAQNWKLSVMEIVIPKVGGIDDDILLTIKDDILCEKLLNVNLLIAKIEALNDNPTLSSDCKTKSSSTSLDSLLEETNTFDNSLPEYEVFYDDHVKKISSGSPTTHSDSPLYASFIFDLSINPFPPADRSDFYEFADELIPFISLLEYDCFLFKVEPNSRDFTKDVVKEKQENDKIGSKPDKNGKQCLSCGALYTGDFCCSKGNVEDRILVPKLPKNYASTNVVNAPREPFVVKQDHGVNPPHIDECCCECGDALDGIFCQQCTCKSCGKCAHIGYNCPPKVLIISNPEPCNQTMNNELPQTLPNFDPTCYSDKENSKQEEKRIEEEQEANARYWKIPACCDDDDDYNSAITPVLSTEEPDNSLSMRGEHLDTISATESDEVIKSSVEDLVPIPSESEGIPDTMCDVHLVNNPTPLEAKDHFEIVINSNDDISSSDDDSLYNENIEYVEAPPHNSELVSLEVAEIVILKEEEIEDDNLRVKLLNVHLLIANIEALKDNPTPSSEFLTKSSSTYPKSFLEETNTFDNSLPEFENFYFDLEEISSGSTTTHSDISLPYYEAFYFDDDHIKEISSGSTTTHYDISLSEYDSFIFDLSNDQFPPIDRSDFIHEEFADGLTYIISPLEYDCFYFRNFPDPGELISILNSGIRENISSTTCVNLPVEDDQSPLLAYSDGDVVFHMLLHGPMNSRSSQACDSVNKNKALRGRHPMLISRQGGDSVTSPTFPESEEKDPAKRPRLNRSVGG
nr:hypothetical protein [Tanacetum cinerariifolium]